MMDRNELLDLIPAYALEALEPDEKRQVEALLATDAEARQILTDYQDIATHLILATPARHAPAHLQADLKQRLAANRSIPAAPKTTERRRTSMWLPLLAAAAIIAIVFGARAYLNRDPAETLYNQIKAASGYTTLPIPGTDATAPNGDMVVSPDGSQAVIRMTRMPPLQADHTFQLWLIDDSGAHSGGLFPFAQADSTYYVIVPLAKNVQTYKAFGVSVEPAGGSAAPSTTPIVVISTT